MPSAREPGRWAAPARPPVPGRIVVRASSPSSASCVSMAATWCRPAPDPLTSSRRQPLQPVNPRVVELLNQALTFELTVTNTYFLQARMLDNWGLGGLGKVFYDLSIAEMKDADELINRILMFDGHPNVQKLNSITVGEDAEEMLTLALASEKAAIAQFNASARECHDLNDHGTAAFFEESVRDEEGHADWFEGQLDAIARVGIQQYLARQVVRDPGSLSTVS